MSGFVDTAYFIIFPCLVIPASKMYCIPTQLYNWSLLIIPVCNFCGLIWVALKFSPGWKFGMFIPRKTGNMKMYIFSFFECWNVSDMVRHELRELRVTCWKVKSTSWNLKGRVQIHELRVQIHELRVQIHESLNQ